LRKHWLLLIVGLVAAVLALGAIACDDAEDDGDGEQPTATAPAEEEATGTPSVEIVDPADGDTVSSPVTLQVSAAGIEIAAAGDAVEGAAHFHAFVDLEPVAEGEVVPQDTAGVFHFATDSIDLDLEPGEHTVTVVLGDNSHVRLADLPEATVTFTVE
jgi:hypothetical protein